MLHMYIYMHTYTYKYHIHVLCVCLHIKNILCLYIYTHILIKNIHRPLSIQVGLRHGPADLAAQCPAEGPGVAWHLRQRGGDQCGGRAPEEAPQKGPPLWGMRWAKVGQLRNLPSLW